MILSGTDALIEILRSPVRHRAFWGRGRNVSLEQGMILSGTDALIEISEILCPACLAQKSREDQG